MSLSTLFGKKLKEIRESRKQTQQQFAEVVGLEPTTIGLIETVKRTISFKTLERIASKLDVSYYELFDFEQNKTDEQLIKSIEKELNKFESKYLKLILNILKLFADFVLNK